MGQLQEFGNGGIPANNGALNRAVRTSTHGAKTAPYAMLCAVPADALLPFSKRIGSPEFTDLLISSSSRLWHDA